MNMSKPTKSLPKKKEVKAWAVWDGKKLDPNLIYSDKKDAERAWPECEVIPVTIRI